MRPPAGTGSLVRLALRRDRIVAPVWIAMFALAAAFSAAATGALYPTVASRVQAVDVLNATPSLVALYGPVFDPTSLGALALWKLDAWGAAMVAVLTMLTVIRHTRAEEEAGRLELLGATALGRGAPLAAALIVAAATALALGVVTALGLVAAGMPVPGSVAFGAAWAACGIAFAAVGGVSAQLTRSARAANGFSAGALAVAFLLRAIGDSAGTGGPAWLSWLSPVGWSEQVRPFAGERWWILLIPAGFAVGVAALAHGLDAARDLDAGLLPDRAGPAAAAPSLHGPLTLAWRLQRGTLAAWVIGFALLGALLGTVASAVAPMLDTAQMRDIMTRLGGQQALSDAYLAAAVSLLGVLASVYAVQAMLRLRTEEQSGRADAVLTGAVGRIRWTVSHAAIAALGPTLLLAVAGIGAGLGDGVHTGDLRHAVLRLTAAALVQLPAVWVLAGGVLALFGLAPRLAAAGWFVLVAVLLIGELGPLLQLRQWVLDLSPFTHLPRLPGPALSATPLVWLTLVALALAAVGLLSVRRRDLA